MSRGELAFGRRFSARVGVVFAAIAMVATFAAPAQAQAGTLDTSFGGDGRVTTFFGHPDDTQTLTGGLAVQPDGKDVVASATGPWNNTDSTFGLARYNLDGSLDSTFGGDGRVKTRFTGKSSAVDVAVQADGKIVALGGVLDAATQHSRVAMARYNPNGSLDPTFGGDGKVVTKLGGDTRIQAITIQADGKIVIVGVARVNGVGWVCALARYDSNGSLDPTFGVGGRVFSDIGITDQGWVDVSVQADGTILTAGTIRPGSLSERFAVARYDAQGTLVPTFGQGGVTTTSIALLPQGGSLSFATALAVRPDGRIVLAGWFNESDTGQGNIDAFALAQYDTDGILDPSFGGGDGIVTAQVNGYAQSWDAVLQPDGRIVEVGRFLVPGGNPGEFLLMRFNTDGSLDPSFGTNGKVKTKVGVYDSFAQAVALQPDGELTVAGAARRTGSVVTTYVSAVLRYQVA